MLDGSRWTRRREGAESVARRRRRRRWRRACRDAERVARTRWRTKSGARRCTPRPTPEMITWGHAPDPVETRGGDDRFTPGGTGSPRAARLEHGGKSTRKSKSAPREPEGHPRRSRHLPRGRRRTTRWSHSRARAQTGAISEESASEPTPRAASCGRRAPFGDRTSSQRPVTPRSPRNQKFGRLLRIGWRRWSAVGEIARTRGDEPAATDFWGWRADT